MRRGLRRQLVDGQCLSAMKLLQNEELRAADTYGFFDMARGFTKEAHQAPERVENIALGFWVGWDRRHMGSHILTHRARKRKSRRVGARSRARFWRPRSGDAPRVSRARATQRARRPRLRGAPAAPSGLFLARTTQKRCPVGASITHHVRTCATRFAPSASRRETSA